MDDKYWIDYTVFIKKVEDLTKSSPAGLIDRYRLLIEELEEEDKGIFEWIYEGQEKVNTRTKIYRVLTCEDFTGNLLLAAFYEQINKLDSRLEKFIKMPEYENWKENFSIDMIDWEKR